MADQVSTILVVDDDEIVARLEQARLRQAGFEVAVCLTTGEALERARQGGIDLAIVDLRLEDDASGLELLQRFHAEGLSFPVIIVTGFSEESTVITALRAGVSDFVPKTRAYLDYLPEAAARVLRQDRTERQLADSEARFVSFMDNSPAVCFIKDERGRFLFANRQLRAMFDIDDWANKTVLDIVPTELADQIHHDDMEALNSGEVTEIHYEASEPDGTPRYWVTYRFPITDGRGQRLLGGVAVDVSEEVRAQEALRASEAKFRSVSESATDAIISIDQSGSVVSWNRAATEMFGYSADEMIGNSLERIVPPRYREANRAALDRVRQYGKSGLRGHPFELWGLRRDGSEFPIELSVGNWQDGEQLFFSGIIRDVSDRKRAADELQKRDDQLRHAQRLEALGTLAGGVAHEFNNLLQSIQGYTQYARDGLEVDDPRRQDLDLVLKAAERAAGLTRQLLGFSRRQMLQYADLDPNAIVRDVARMLRPLIGEHIRLELSLGEGIGSVHADPTHLQQLLMNLAINARDAMPGGGQLLIKTEPVTLTDESAANYPGLKPGPYLQMIVSDTGCGMSPEVLQHAFEPFFTTKEVGQGTGLGLASVYGVVTQHRGSIRVYSEPGVGTSFTIMLPVVTPTAEKPRQAVAVPRARGHETVLVAEDEPLVRDLALRALAGAGYRTLHAADGPQALEIFRQRREEISLVMLDVVMPGINGHEVYQKMREIDPRVRVVFSSAYDLETAQLGFIAEQGLRFVPKPCEPARLLQTVRAVLDEAPGGSLVVPLTVPAAAAPALSDS